MPSISALLTAAIAAGSDLLNLPHPDTLVTHPTTGRRTISLTQVRNEAFVPRGPLALAKAYRKYKVPIPADLRTAVARLAAVRRSTGSAVTTPQEYDVEYLTPVSIGTPPQNLSLDLDTGSSDLWVFSTETPKSEVDGQTVYDPGKSSTAEKLQGATWEITYGDGSSSSGDVYLDNVTVGGLTVPAQAIECASKVSDEFTSDSNSDGLMGLAFDTINTVEPVRQKTFFENAQSGLDEPLFTADLKSGKPGHYNFGYIDPSAYTGNITYVPVNSSDGFWGWTSPGYAVGSGGFKSKTIQGIVDTGTTLLLLPRDVVSDYYSEVSGASYSKDEGGYIFDCSTTPPDFLFGVDERSGDESSGIRIPGRYVNYAPVSSGSSKCYGGIQRDDSIGFSIFGDVALKAAFVVFDAGTMRVGFASKALS